MQEEISGGEIQTFTDAVGSFWQNLVNNQKMATFCFFSCLPSQKRIINVLFSKFSDFFTPTQVPFLIGEGAGIE